MSGNGTSTSAPETEPAPSHSATRYAVLGNPNTGKTTLFNQLCGLRARTGNFPGITVDARIGSCSAGEHRFELVDLPGVYGLSLDLPESRFCRETITDPETRPDAALVVVDASNLPRNLVLAGEVIATGIRTVVALNMVDIVAAKGSTIDVAELESRLGCPVLAVNARRGEGCEALRDALSSARSGTDGVTAEMSSSERAAWAAETATKCRTLGKATPASSRTDRVDRVLMHPFGGLLFFAAVMTGLFFCIFSLATVPMDGIEALFGYVGGGLQRVMPEGELRDLLVDGVVGGIAGTVVFLPQIFLLFFLISLLEDTGYLARAAFVVDRIVRRCGLPGQAFVPLLSSHACAIPGIMCARLIPDRRDRIATILVAPFMSCSARLPVYVLLVGFLFGDEPLWAGVAFAGCYALGVIAALATAVVARRTLLRGPSRPMFLELPTYKRPSVKTALLTGWDRSMVFLRKAGTVILGICIVLWWLSSHPGSPEAEAILERASVLAETDADAAADLEAEAARVATEHSYAGKIGRTLEPVFEPLGYDWQLSIAVFTSFAAREVFVSTLAVVVGTSEEDPRILHMLENASRSDGSPLLTTAVAASLLIFYVLAMQCLPTVAVTGREAGGWRWALLQLAYMSAVAYGAAWITYRIVLGAS